MGQSLTSFIASNAALIGPTLVTIQGGTFTMGGGTDYSYQAAVSTFQMGRTPVTNDEYDRYYDSLDGKVFAAVGINQMNRMPAVFALGPEYNDIESAIGSRRRKEGDILVVGGLNYLFDSLQIKKIEPRLPAKFHGGFSSEVSSAPRHPVVFRSWYDAFIYAFLHGGMLPTELQWEYAARVVQGRENLRDYATPSGLLTRAEAHYAADTTADVDDPRYPTLENGLRHMMGNVWEWQQNRYPGRHPIEEDDLILPIKWDSMTLRGGCWCGDIGLGAACRMIKYQDEKSDLIGFRVAAPTQTSNQ